MTDGRLLGLRPGNVPHRHGRERAVVQHGLVVEKVEALKHHADLLPQGVEVDLEVHEILPVEPDVAGIGFLQQIDAAQQRGLAGAGRADDAHDLAAVDLQVDALEHVEVAEGLFELFDFDDGIVRHSVLLSV